MLKKSFLFIFIIPLLLIIVFSCNDNSTDPPLNNPVISNPEFNYNARYNTHLIASVDVNDPDGLDNVDSVWGWYRYMADANTHTEFSMADDGIGFDLWQSDGTFTGLIIPLDDFKEITDWSAIEKVSFVFEAWNLEKPKGMVIIDDISFYKIRR